MATAKKRKLSSSTDGRPILITATGTAGTLIHTSVAGTVEGTFDEIWLYASNFSSSDRTLNIEWGGTTSPDDIISTAITSKSGLMLLIPGLILQDGTEVRAFIDVTGSALSVSGFVNTITD